MRSLLKIVAVSVIAGVTAARASNLDTVGVALLRATTTNLNGAGVRVAQPEAYNGDNGSTNSWEVNPTNVAQPVALFTYTSGLGTSNSYPNSVGDWSSHADAVGNNFYGLPNGVATNAAHVDNFDATYFYDDIIAATFPPDINDPVVNQSFIFGSVPGQISVAQQQQIDSDYDDYAAQYKTLFISGAGNGGSVCPPATCYNGIGVGVDNGSSSAGPTVDNGRCKPDITAPGFPAGLTSFSTPLVSGAAAVLKQAGARGDGGSDTNSAADIRTVKALLLNGAVKPANWTNSTSSPLDMRYGAGVLNVFNSYEQLAGGEHNFNFSTNVPMNTAHPPVVMANSIAALNGWDFTNITSTAIGDAVNHYFFNLTNNSSAPFAAAITLVWNRQQSQTDINDLNLFLYNCADSNLMMCSTSLVDNVEHIFLPKLMPGRYDLQVWKAAGIPTITIVSNSETYALAWNFFLESLDANKSGTNLDLSWPVYPAGFAVEAATNLSSPVWRTNGIPPSVLTNNQNAISIPATNAVRFFRLRTPDF